MKRTVSLILLLAMLASAVLFTVPASASKEKSDATAENIDYVDALYFEKAPSIDGYITEAEWGAPSVTVEATDCATRDDTEPYNRFIFWRTGDMSDYSSWYYTVWFRWDENYFYIAAKVKDPDKHQLRNGTTETWNGDAFQTRIDPLGPNAVTGGEEFEVNEIYMKPWSSQNIPDFLFGYVEIAGGFSESWENTSNKGMTKFSKNPMGEALCVVAPCGSDYSPDTLAGYTTYEIGIPWAYIMNGQNDKDGNQITALTHTEYRLGRTNGNITGGIGREYGVSMVCLNDGTNPDAQWDSWMAWGSGICTAHQEEGARSATGSNSVMLAEEAVQQGEYQKYDPTRLLDATFSQENIDPVGVYYDYLNDDFDKQNPVTYDQLSVIDYEGGDADLGLWGTWVDPFEPRTGDIGGSHGYVLDYRWNDGTTPNSYLYVLQTVNNGIYYYWPTSFTFQFDICYTDTKVFSEGRPSVLANLFGGSSGSMFNCGYWFDSSRFMIKESWKEDNVYAMSEPYDLKKNTWYTWRFQYDNDSCNVRLWVDDLSTTADDGDGWGEMVLNVCFRYFYYSSDTAKEKGQVLCFRQENVQLMYDNVRIYNFAQITEIAPPAENGTDGGAQTAVTTTTTETGGGEIAIDTGKVYKKDGSWYVPVFAKSEYATATQLSFTLEYDPAKAEFTGIEGLADGTYTVTEKTKGKVEVVIKDFAAIKALKAGDKYFEFILKALDDTATASDLSLKLADAYVYTVTTGDAMTFIVIGGVFALAIAATVFAVRRKKEEE